MVRKGKIFVSIVLTALLVLTSVSFNVIAAQNQEILITDTIDIAKNNVNSTTDLVTSTSSYELAIQEVVDAAKKYISEVDISSYAIDRSDMPKFVEDLLYDNPELFYVDNSVGYSYFSSNNTVSKVMLTFNFTQEEVLNEQGEIDEISSYIVNKTQSMQTEAEKALFVHDYLVLNTQYDYNLLETGTALDMSYSMYGALIDNIAVCQGYMLAYIYLLEQIGIESVDVSSDTMNHTWNLVNIDDNWYHVDVTWDDPTPDIYGRVMHNHFLLNNTEISSNHSGFTPEFPANSTDFSNAFWKNVSTQIVNMNGDLFYFTATKQLKKVNIDGVELETIPYTTDSWEAFGTGGANYSGNYAKMATDYSEIYYNTSKGIYSMDFNGANNELIYTPNLEEGTLIYGLVIKDGYLQYSTSSSPNEDDTLYNTGIMIEESGSKLVLRGDINFDGKLNIIDLLECRKYIAKMITFTEDQIKVADLNDDGRLSLPDVVYMQFVLGKILPESYIYI